jgi:hypothetical protein
MSTPVKRSRRAAGRQLLSELASLHREKAKILREKSELDLRLSTLEQLESETMQKIATNGVELETAKRARKYPNPPVGTPRDDLAVRAARAVMKVIG